MEAGDLVSGKYRLQRQLGAGSMGSVWAARNELTNRDFAVKFLRPELSRDEEALHRFFLEARACGQIRHPAIVDVYDMGQAEDGSPYLVMELLEGEGFDQRLARQTRLRPVEVCRYLAIVARGLEEAHTRGLIHRDLKPGNIFFAIDKSGEVFPKVLDFGISKELSADDFVKTSTGAVLGSPAYMSPEQAGGEIDVDARSDIWALGVILYEALSGDLPFDATNYNALMVRIINEPHVPLSERLQEVPTELSHLVDACLAKERRERVASAGELADRLERIYATLTDTPFTQPHRHFSLPPLEGTTQIGWFRVTAQGKRRFSPAVWIGTALAAVGISAGVVLSLAATPKVPLAARVGTTVRATVAQAEGEFTAADARKKTEAAEAAAREAERRALEAEASKTRASKTAPSHHRPAGGKASGPASPKPPANQGAHGVAGPGF